MAHYLTVGKRDDFRSGNIQPVSIGGTEIAVARVGDDFHAFSNECTHSHEWMSDGFISKNDVICAYHDACFDLTTGEALSGPAFYPLPIYVVRVEGDEVQVEWPEAVPADQIALVEHDEDERFRRQFVI